MTPISAKTLEKSVFMIERMNAFNHFDKMSCQKYYS